MIRVIWKIFALLDAEDNISGPLSTGFIADLLLFKIILTIR